MSRLFLLLKNKDWILSLSVLLLLSFSLAEIYSVALGQNDLNLINFKKQILFIGIGIAGMFFFALLDYQALGGISLFVYLFGIFILLSVLFFGTEIRGTRGWFGFAGFGIQPVEFAKIFLIIFLAKYFSSKRLNAKPLKYLILSGLTTFVYVFLILQQPDFGSALLLFAIWVGMAFIVGFKKRYFLVIIVLALISISFAWVFLFKAYQQQRVMTFLNPSFDPLNQGYNVYQAIIAVGSGGIHGRGIGFGSQSQLKFLPESQTDFIFAVISEELGFFGVSLILAFFSIFFLRSIYLLRNVKDNFGIFFIIGAIGLIFIEMFINIGMNIGLLPVVGISLPFLSYGGSSIISSLFILGIMQSIIIRSKLNY